MILKKLYHGNLKVCRPKRTLLLPLLIIEWHENSNFCSIFKESCLKQKKRAKYLIVHLRTKLLWVGIPLPSNKIMFELIKKKFAFKLTSLVKRSNHTKWKCVSLTLKQLGDQFAPLPPCGFSKNVSSKERMKAVFFMSFNIIKSCIFLESLIETLHVVQKLWRVFCEFLWEFWVFRGHFLVTKKLMKSSYNRWCQNFFTLLFQLFQHTWNKLFNNCMKLP